MGNSDTARYGDGWAVHGPDAVWPAWLRPAWPQVAAQVHQELAKAAPARSSSISRSIGRPHATPTPPTRTILTVLLEPRWERPLARLARRWRVDEAEVAALWAASPAPTDRATQRLVAAKLRLAHHVEAVARRALARLGTRPFRRIPVATRAALHQRILDAVAPLGLEEVPRGRPGAAWKARVAAWTRSPAGNASLQRALSFGPRITLHESPLEVGAD